MTRRSWSKVDRFVKKLSERRVPAKVSESKASEFVGVDKKQKFALSGGHCWLSVAVAYRSIAQD